MALFARERTGRGQLVDAALYECAFSFMEPHVPAFEKLGVVANRAGSRLPDNVPNNLYATADNEFIHITAANDGIFRRLAATMGQAALIEDPRFSTAVARAQHEGELDDLIAGWTTSKSLAELERQLEAASVPATRIFTIADIFGDPQYRARDMLVSAPHDELGEVVVAGIAPKLSETPGSVRHAGRRVGADTERVLREVAGLADAEIASLAKSGVIYCANGG